MSVVSAPSGAGRSLYNSEPSIEATEATNRVGRNRPEPRRTPATLRLSRANHNPSSTCRMALRMRPPVTSPGHRKVVEETVELTTARSVSVKAVMATYPSLRASRLSALEYSKDLSEWDSIDGTNETQTRRPSSEPWKRSANRDIHWLVDNDLIASSEHLIRRTAELARQANVAIQWVR